MASPTRWTWVWVNSGSWQWTERPGLLRFMGSQRVGRDWATELNWTELKFWGKIVMNKEVESGHPHSVTNDPGRKKWFVFNPLTIQFSSVTQSCPTPCNPMDYSTPGLSVYHQLPEFTQSHVQWVLSRWCHPTISSSVIPFSSCLQSFPASGSFQMSQSLKSGGQSIAWSFSFNISPSNEYSGLISFRMDWLDLLAVQGTLKSLLWHHSSKASILQCSAFFTVQFSHPYMTTGKTIALTRQTFVGNVSAFKMLSRLVTTFLPRRKCLLTSWLQSPSAAILVPPKWSMTLFPLFPHLFAMKWWDQMPWS